MGAFRRSMAGRRPSGAMVVALIALVAALSGPAYAAVSVLFAKRAGNANRVDGLRAFRRPHANGLLALDSHGKFPASIGFVGQTGPPGAVGAQGAVGPTV